MKITAKQQDLLTYLEKKLNKTDKAPSLREIAGDLDISHSTVSHQLKELERKGFIARDGHYGRTITLYPASTRKKRDQSIKELPIIGQVTAGLPMYAQQEWEGSVVVDPRLFPGENLFCLRIKGQSMRDAGILNGDLVVCEPRQYAENGEIIVALVHGDEATVKYFQLQKDHIDLIPANTDFKTTSYEFNELMIQGKVKGVIRDTIIE